MISKDNFTAENMRRLQKETHRDPALIERLIYAFGLLESLAACILTGSSDFKRIRNPRDYLFAEFSTEFFNRLTFVKKTDTGCFGYLIETERLLTENDISLI